MLFVKQELAGQGMTVPLEMERSLQLLHSYVIVRSHIRRGQHLMAARLLIRVAESISKFPAREYFSSPPPSRAFLEGAEPQPWTYCIPHVSEILARVAEQSGPFYRLQNLATVTASA